MSERLPPPNPSQNEGSAGHANVLQPADYEALLTAVCELHRHLDLATLPEASLGIVNRLVTNDLGAFDEYDLLQGSRRNFVYPESMRKVVTRIAPIVERLRHEHPLTMHFRQSENGAAVRNSDFIELAAFKKLEIYRKAFVLTGPYGIAITLYSSSQTLIGYWLQRHESDFSKRDCAMLNAFRPHLLLAFENAAAFTRPKAPASVRESAVNPAAIRPPGLTKREAEVLRWMAEAKSNREIATILGISVRTVEKHAERVFAKLGVENRLGAIRQIASHQLRGRSKLDWGS